MKKRVRILAAACAVLSVLAGASPSPANVAGKFCSTIQDIVGFGTPSQLAAHYEIFIPAFEAKCAKASGAISYFSGDENATFARMLFRGPNYDDVDLFWARDSAISESERAQLMTDTGSLRGRYSPLGQFPVSVSGLAVAYNLSCTTKPLNLSTLNLSLMYLGQITTWNDQRIIADQPADVQKQLASCTKSVKLTGRADSAGETGTFKAYLGSGNPIWSAYSQPQLNTQWPSPLVCRGGGDGGEAGCVASNSGSVGYVSILRAKRQGLRVANVERLRIERKGLSAVDLSNPQATNPAQLISGGLPLITPRDFVAPSLSGCTTAADSIQFPAGFDNYSDWNQAALVNANDGYPVCYFSFLNILKRQQGGYSSQASTDQSATLRDYMSIIFSGAVQKKLVATGYGKLPRKILDMNKRGIVQIEGNGDCPLPVQPPPHPAIGPIQGYDGLGCFGIAIGKIGP